jgi:hypothetical protein
MYAENANMMPMSQQYQQNPISHQPTTHKAAHKPAQ